MFPRMFVMFPGFDQAFAEAVPSHWIMYPTFFVAPNKTETPRGHGCFVLPKAQTRIHFHPLYTIFPEFITTYNKVTRLIGQYECTLIQLIQLVYQKCISYNPYSQPVTANLIQ